jgi:hypothetical protein
MQFLIEGIPNVLGECPLQSVEHKISILVSYQLHLIPENVTAYCKHMNATHRIVQRFWILGLRPATMFCVAHIHFHNLVSPCIFKKEVPHKLNIYVILSK